MNGIFATIEGNDAKFTKSEKRVADFIFENPQRVLYTSITDLAEMCGVGDTTVFRFCKALKLNGYQEFKMLLAQDISNSNGSNNVLVGTINPDDDVKTVCEKALSTNIAALNETFHVLDFDAVSKAVDLISAARRIHFFGMGSSGVIALEGKQKFMRILPNVEYVSDCHMQYMAASLLDSRDLAVIVSYSGSTKDMIEIHKLIKKNGCKSICITRFAKSSLTNIADVVLLCGSNEGPLEGGASSTTMVQLYILDVLYLQYFIKHYNQSRENKSRTTESISNQLL
jgi:DNA-binding MurR/RpiR family transcriptional regulator